MELKVFTTTIYNPSTRHGVVYNVYNKDEADRYIAHQKYKRCLAMAMWCETNVYNIRRKPLCDMDDHEGWQHDDEFWQRWHNRWLQLAEKFNRNLGGK